jgi:predicted phosphoribosyltransferase
VTRFVNRLAAGQALASHLSAYRDRDDVLVLGLARGGVPVAAEVAAALHAPLDVFVVRKLGLPGHQELAMGAIASGGAVVHNASVLSHAEVSPETLQAVTTREQAELLRREASYRGQRPALPVKGRTVLLVDDGLATGTSMRAAIAALRLQSPRRVVVAVPVGAAETCAELANEVDDVVCAETPPDFFAVGMHYHDFRPTTDDEVRGLIEYAGGSSQ